MFKDHPIFILVPIVSSPISSPVVDQHPVATTDDEPIEDVDPIALDVVMDIPLRGLERARRPAISNDTLSTRRSMSMMWVMYQIQLPTNKPLLVLNQTSRSMQ